jgi:hypothetical protein
MSFRWWRTTSAVRTREAGDVHFPPTDRRESVRGCGERAAVILHHSPNISNMSPEIGRLQQTINGSMVHREFPLVIADPLSNLLTINMATRSSTVTTTKPAGIVVDVSCSPHLQRSEASTQSLVVSYRVIGKRPTRKRRTWTCRFCSPK